MGGICSFDNEGGGGQRVCCLAPVEVVSTEAKGLIKLYSQNAPTDTLCNLLFTPPHQTLSLPVWLRCHFSWQLNARSEGASSFFSEKKKRKETWSHENTGSWRRRRMQHIAVTRPPSQTTSDPTRRRAEHIITPYVGKERGGEGGQWGDERLEEATLST